MKNATILAIAALTLAACGESAELAEMHKPTTIGKNGDCSVVRLYDYDRYEYVYVTDCSGGSNVQWDADSGKHHRRVTTNTIPAESQ